jgi:hypothetical protein
VAGDIAWELSVAACLIGTELWGFAVCY